MSKHTKGPWNYEPSTKTIRSSVENYWLATMDSWDGSVNNEANAHVIAAAPDMLELLDELSDVFSDLTDEDTLLSKQMYKKIRDVIAKAEGKVETDELVCPACGVDTKEGELCPGCAIDAAEHAVELIQESEQELKDSEGVNS